MPFNVYHLIPGRSLQHFKNCLMTGQQTSPPGWDVVQRPVFWGGQKGQITGRLQADGLNFEQDECVFIDGTHRALWRWLRRLARDEAALVMHSVPTRYFWFLLRTCPSLLQRTAWIGWGAGVYNPWKQREAGMTPLKWVWFKPFRYCVPRLGIVSSHHQEDARRLESMVGPLTSHATARYNLQGLPDRLEPRQPTPTINVCVGHRAGKPEDYQAVFESLGQFTDAPMTVHAPLSYGHREHVDTVIETGRTLLGDRFHPMTEFMPLDDYFRFMRTIDTLIMPGPWAQGGFNINFALSVGTRVFIHDESPMLEEYHGLGCDVMATSHLPALSFQELSTPQPLNVQQQNFDGIGLYHKRTHDGWQQLFARLVPTAYQKQEVKTCP